MSGVKLLPYLRIAYSSVVDSLLDGVHYIYLSYPLETFRTLIKNGFYLSRPQRDSLRFSNSHYLFSGSCLPYFQRH
jgi:hypothetical protein